MSDRPPALEVSDRVLVLYAIARRGAIELVVNETQGDPTRLAQAERARIETERWLERESLIHEVRGTERSLLDAPSGSWPTEAVSDTMWRKEAMGMLLWALQHIDRLPDVGTEFVQADLDGTVTRYGSVSGFRANGQLRRDDQIERAWLGLRVVRRDRGPHRGGCGAGLDRGRAVPRAQLAARRCRRASVSTDQAASAMSPRGIR